MRNTRFLILTLVIVALTQGAYSSSIGTVPSSFDLGELEPGESIEQDVFIRTEFSQEFSISPSLSEGPRSRHFSTDSRFYGEVTEAEFESWIDIEGATINPNESEEVDLNGEGLGDQEDVSEEEAEGDFSFSIDVPNNAEPGYYFGSLRLNPEITGGDDGAGTTNWGETSPTIRFRVPGQVDRNIEVTDVNGIRVGENRVQIVVQLTNTGTVTTRITEGEMSIIEEDRSIDNMSFPAITLAPGETAEVDRTWSNSEVSGGTYQVEGVGDYRTGETYISGDFTITDVIRDPVDIDEPEAETEDDTDIPYTLLLMVLLFLGVILYLLEVDLVWTIIFVGVTGIGLFILFSSAPSYLILILAAIIGVTLYYGI